MATLAKGEYDRMWRVLDMTISGHSLLRDRYRRRGQILTLTVMALSIVATALAFVSGAAHVRILGAGASLATWLGSLSAFIFFISLFELVVDWRRLAWTHGHAAQRLSELKGKFRAVTFGEGEIDSGAVDLAREYEEVMANIAKLPERQFLAIKSKHRRKVVLSRLIDEHPGAPLPVLRVIAMLQGIRNSVPLLHPVDEPVERSPAE